MLETIEENKRDNNRSGCKSMSTKRIMQDHKEFKDDKSRFWVPKYIWGSH